MKQFLHSTHTVIKCLKYENVCIITIYLHIYIYMRFQMERKNFHPSSVCFSQIRTWTCLLLNVLSPSSSSSSQVFQFQYFPLILSSKSLIFFSEVSNLSNLNPISFFCLVIGNYFILHLIAYLFVCIECFILIMCYVLTALFLHNSFFWLLASVFKQTQWVSDLFL